MERFYGRKDFFQYEPKAIKNKGSKTFPQLAMAPLYLPLELLTCGASKMKAFNDMLMHAAATHYQHSSYRKAYIKTGLRTN